MANEEKPPEEELSLTGPAPKAIKPAPAGQSSGPQRGTQGGPPQEEPERPKIEARVRHLEIAKDATDEDVLSAVLEAPEEKLFTWELCELPSGGAFYGWPDGQIRVRPMTQTAEKALATQRLAQTGQSIDYLLRECCQFPNNFDPINLLLGDRIFLLYYLRGITHGNIYEFAMTCPNGECQQTSTHSYDLNELAGTIKRPNPAIGKEPFRVVLPYLSEATGRDFWVSVRFMRGIDANNMLASRKRKQAAQAHAGGTRNPLQRKQEQARQRMKLDDTITENLQQVIADVMGNDQPHTIASLLQRMHATDTASIREWLRENTPGIDTTIAITCPDCDREFTVELPITETFFRPTSNRSA